MGHEPKPALALWRAFRTGRQVLIERRRAHTFAVLTLASWLATFGDQLRIRVPGLGPARGPLPGLQRLAVEEFGPWTWVVLAAVTLVVGFAVALRVATLFVESRGAFVFLDGVARDCAALARPWRRHAALADALFTVRVQLAVAQLAAILPSAAMLLVVLGGWAWVSPGDGDALVPAAMLLAAGCVAHIGVVGVAGAAVTAVLVDLVVPLMRARRCDVHEAAWIVADAARRCPWAVWRYAVIRSALGAGLCAARLSVGTLCCCVSWIPFVSAGLLLPLTVVHRAFGLHLAEMLPEASGSGVRGGARAAWGATRRDTSGP